MLYNTIILWRKTVLKLKIEKNDHLRTTFEMLCFNSQKMETAAYTTGKIALKIGANMVCPGAGSVVDILEMLNDIKNGDLISASINFYTVCADVVSLGLFSKAKDVAKEAGKEAGKNAAKETCKESSKDIGTNAAKEIAKGAPKKATVEAAKASVKQANKEIGKAYGKELASGLIKEGIEEAFTEPTLKSVAKQAGCSLLGSGGKNIGMEMFEAVGTGVAMDMFSSTSSSVGLKMTTKTAKEARKAINEVADAYLSADLKRNVAVNGIKGYIKYYRDRRDREK